MTTPEPGKAWMCENGQRHFICPGCGNLFTSNPEQTEAEREQEAQENLGAVPEEDDRISVCDDCYPVLLAEAKEAGLI
jgi:hypothetical protein